MGDGTLSPYLPHAFRHQVSLCLGHEIPQADPGGRGWGAGPWICAEHEVEILKGHVSRDHVHLFVSCPPHVSASALMHRVKGKTARKLLMEFKHLRRQLWGRHVWARGFFVASSGNITDEVIAEYIRTQDFQRDDDDFRVES